MCRILGRGRSGTVYLARHMELEEYRAIKQVAKTCTDYSQFRKEALILKTIRHPGIPIVYDLEEDEDYSYLIEEYLEGNSLYALISETGHFSKAMTIRYGIQICHLVNILHSARPTPILYLDLQPKNLIICHDTVKLIDFDHAVHLSDAKNLSQRYGTVGCAAPEQYTGDVLDERTDIYAIGAVLHYMLTGHYPGEGDGKPLQVSDSTGRNLMRIIRRCLSEDREKRYETADQLCRAMERAEAQLRKLEKQRQGIWRSHPVSSLTIAVAGSRPGVGTTHTAIGLAAYLRRQGISAVYEEHNETGAIRQLTDWFGAGHDRWGIFVIRGLPVRPWYGSCVQLEETPYPVRILDYGCSRKQLFNEQADLEILVCGAKPWEQASAYEAYGELKNCPGLILLMNHFSRQAAGGASGARYRKSVWAKEKPVCFLMPDFPDPFSGDRAADQVYQAMMNRNAAERRKERAGGGIRKLYGKGKNLFFLILRQLTGKP